MTSHRDNARPVIGLPGALAGLLLAVLTCWTTTASAGGGLANTKHNFTSTGPGSFKVSETEATGLCTFCHTPHNANPSRALWNRALSAATYTLYASSTLKAVPTQPTGTSRLCLSCHDGTLAMGTLLRPPGGVQYTLGKLTGVGVLGTDLSNDHPVSFTYDSQLAASRGELANPQGAPKELHLDVGGQLQCTSCHDAHANRAKFMRFDPVKGALCTTCHQPAGWPSASHATSVAEWRGTNGTDISPWPNGGYATVQDNACMSCHRTHAAGHGKGLLAQIGEADNCIVCHSGKVAKENFNLANEFAKPSSHPIDTAPWTHKPKEDASLMTRHVACVDCHNPHVADASTATAPNVTGPLKGVQGIRQDGVPVPVATYEQEVCYKCHGLASATTLGVQRQDNVRNVRLAFNPGNSSFHPVAAIGRNPTIPDSSFVTASGLTASSRIGCGSCHNNNEWTAAGDKPAGPHGSIYPPLLAMNYNTANLGSKVTYSDTEFALCYKCHLSSALTVDIAGKFPHAKHLNNSISPTSCATCHDAHGSPTQSNLINFVLFDALGKPVVTAFSNTIEFNKVGRSCTLMCHGKEHSANLTSY